MNKIIIKTNELISDHNLTDLEADAIKACINIEEIKQRILSEQLDKIDYELSKEMMLEND